jgi:methylated-DNA-protein-cysteine methyltransferase-like protein
MLKAQASRVPWQRVINREGGVSTRGLEQRHLLESEGVSFDERERVPLSRFRWAGPSPEWAAAHGCQILPPRPEDDAEQLRMF